MTVYGRCPIDGGGGSRSRHPKAKPLRLNLTRCLTSAIAAVINSPTSSASRPLKTTEFLPELNCWLPTRALFQARSVNFWRRIGGPLQFRRIVGSLRRHLGGFGNVVPQRRCFAVVKYNSALISVIIWGANAPNRAMGFSPVNINKARIT